MADLFAKGATNQEVATNARLPRPNHSDDQFPSDFQYLSVVGSEWGDPLAPIPAKRKRKAKGAARKCVETIERLPRPNIRSDHVTPEAPPHGVAAPDLAHDGQSLSDHHAKTAVVGEIQVLWRRRQAWHRAEKAMTLRAKDLCRTYVGGSKTEGNKLFAAVTKAPMSNDHALSVAAAILPLMEHVERLKGDRLAFERGLTKLVNQLPINKWVKSVRGFGLINLAGIIGETGDLSDYSNPAKVWKRMGLAVMPDGKRQRRVKGVDALEQGYNAARRSVAWNLGECIVKVGGEHSPYRALYLERRELERSKISQGVVQSIGHAHNRAARYMTKRVLRDLWIAWRRATQRLNTTTSVPADNSEQQATNCAKPITPVPAESVGGGRK